MDLDSTRGKYSYQKILDRFASGETDILVGTQMVSKGLDFDHVQLVGILDADRLMAFPDFRSQERAFQLMMQVGGRAGRREEKGLVVIQCARPDHPIFKNLIQNDYEPMAEWELTERKRFAYPPFVRMIKITIKHEDKDHAREMSTLLTSRIRQGLGDQRVLGPEENLIARIRNDFIFNVIIKLERDKLNIGRVKKFLLEEGSTLIANKLYRKGKVFFDVDPY
jgi:primosomal protein N' (replication factor Y)